MERKRKKSAKQSQKHAARAGNAKITLTKDIKKLIVLGKMKHFASLIARIVNAKPIPATILNVLILVKEMQGNTTVSA
jgi:hypothetical protein